jgi:predicted N-acetyltransferase YhbS
MITLLTCPDNELPPYVRWQALSFLRMEWPSIFQGELRLTQHLHDPVLQPFHFALVEAEILISYATAVRMELDHSGSRYRIAGLANVLTYPPFRKEGHGARIVRAATDHIRASDADVAALFCQSSLGPFYARAGWEAMQGCVTQIGPAESPRPLDALRMMLFLSEKGKAGRTDFEERPWYIGHHW